VGYDESPLGQLPLKFLGTASQWNMGSLTDHLGLAAQKSDAGQSDAAVANLVSSNY